MSWQDVRHWYEEQDDPPEPKRPRCPRCKAFLPWQPTGKVKKTVGVDYHYTYDADGNETGVVVDKEHVEDVEVWDCKACGDFHEWEEVYGD